MSKESEDYAAMRQPYIISIENKNYSKSVYGFTILDGYMCVNNPNFKDGSMCYDGVYVKDCISNLNYQTFVLNAMHNPKWVGITYIELVSGDASQLLKSFVISTQDNNGNCMMRTIFPQNVGEFDKNFVKIKQLYSLDGFTKIIFSEILPNTHFRVHLYPPDESQLEQIK